MGFLTLFPNLITYWDKFVENVLSTLQMFIISGIFSFILGIIFGVALTIFKKGGIAQNKIIYGILSVFINVFRSIPFIILLVFLIPFTRSIVGTSIGVKGAIIPLIFGVVPFYARQVETALENVAPGKIEAARSMGSSTIGIIFRVYLHESIPELIRVTTITAISLIGLTTMAGAVGAGGLGDFAINYGQGLNHSDIIYACIIVLLLLISFIQFIGSFLAKATTNKELFRFKHASCEAKKFYLTSGLIHLGATLILITIASVTIFFVSDNTNDKIEVKIGVCGANNDQWKAVQYVLDQNGYNIDIDLVEFSAYNLPNEALNSGDIDLNSFQHQAYLDNEVAINNYNISSIGKTVVAPLTLFSKNYSSVEEIKAAAGTIITENKQIRIALPKDPTNLGRGLKVLEACGLISVDPEAGYTPEIKDITLNYNIEIVPQDANTLPTTLTDYAGALINATYAIPAGLLPSRDGLYTEETSSDNPYLNIIAARNDELDRPEFKAIVEAFNSQIVAEYILIKYNEAFYPAFSYDEFDINSVEVQDRVKLIDETINLVETNNTVRNIVLTDVALLALGLVSLTITFTYYNKKQEEKINE